MGKNKIIAEIGCNHQGNMDLAKELILLAKNNGANLVKFQLYDTDKLLGKDKLIREGDILRTVIDSELNKEQAMDLFRYGKKLGIEVFFSVFDVDRVKWCEEMGVKRYKIACTFRDTDTLEAVCDTGKPVIISSQNTPPDFLNIEACLYCVPKYPTPIEDIDFAYMSCFDGFSDHSIGLDAVKRALEYGVSYIEKHFAIDHKTGVDAQWSMTPKELKELVGYSSNYSS